MQTSTTGSLQSTSVPTKISLSMVRKAMEKTGRFLVNKKGNILTLTRIVNGKEMSCRIVKKSNQKLLELDLNYHFVSKISYFDYSSGETRLCRNKTIIASFLHELKKAEVWHLFDKSFLKLNENNKNARSKRIKKELNNLLGN